MKKVHNNLNIENLIRTEHFKNLTLKQKEELLTNSQWFNQFNGDQQEQIILGLVSSVDISIYAKPEFDDWQMCQIRDGLEDNLDVSIYAKIGFNWEQMNVIREGLKDNVDVSIYAKPEYSGEEMEEIRQFLEDNKSFYTMSDNKKKETNE